MHGSTDTKIFQPANTTVLYNPLLVDCGFGGYGGAVDRGLQDLYGLSTTEVVALPLTVQGSVVFTVF